MAQPDMSRFGVPKRTGHPVGGQWRLACGRPVKGVMLYGSFALQMLLPQTMSRRSTQVPAWKLGRKVAFGWFLLYYGPVLAVRGARMLGKRSAQRGLAQGAPYRCTLRKP